MRAPIDPNGCAKAPPGGALNTPRPGIGGAGLGPGKLAALGGLGGAGLVGGGVLGGGGGGGFIGGGGGGGGSTTPVHPITPIPPTGPIVTPPPITTTPPVVVPGNPGTPVPEPSTVVVFAMALGALCLVRLLASRRPEPNPTRS